MQQFGCAYAERVIGNLVGDERFCTSCGPDCVGCRRRYERRFADDIVGDIALPAVLPHLLEQPARHVPAEVPPHEIMLAINVHEQVLVEMLRRCRDWGTRGVVVPIEAPPWVSGSAREQAKAICGELGVEVAFPKPFCDFDPPPGGPLAAFREQFHVGKPRVELTVRDGRIERAHVHASAACGATYYIARWLEGKRVDDDLKYEVVAKRLHSYPCTASMAWDDDLGDTILHVAGKAHYEILAGLPGQVPADEGSDMVVSPLGRMLPKPVPARDNVRQIARAKEAVLESLAAGKEVSLEGLRRDTRLSAAALSSAIVLLKQAGRIRTEGGRILRV